jgi:hypothetical protein
VELDQRESRTICGWIQVCIKEGLCDGHRDPFTKKMGLMIKNFSLDVPTKPKKFL